MSLLLLFRRQAPDGPVWNPRAGERPLGAPPAKPPEEISLELKESSTEQVSFYRQSIAKVAVEQKAELAKALERKASIEQDSGEHELLLAHIRVLEIEIGKLNALIEMREDDDFLQFLILLHDDIDDSFTIKISNDTD